MNNLRTYEEWSVFGRKKELTPDEEYQKQKREAEKEAKKHKPVPEDKPRVGFMGTKPSKGDPYGEEYWDEEEEERVASDVARKNERQYRAKVAYC
jgi:hypothetical protein